MAGSQPQPGGTGASTTLHNCNGGAGGSGGVGGGPGAINNGGSGGHGEYYHRLLNPSCTAKSTNADHTFGAAGGNGRVTITW